MSFKSSRSVAVVGAGIAGAAVAHALLLAGHAVHMVDKSRGPGGRLATRHVEWIDQHGQACTTQFDHGAVGITARSAAFQRFIDQALHAGWLAEWAPALAAGSLALENGDRPCLPTPDLPSLCRHLLAGTAATWSFSVDSLHRGPLGWQLQAAGERHSQRFDAVVLAMPPAQAAPLLFPHRHDWARHASLAPMQPCWTLMGVADDPQPALGWDLARPPTGLWLGCCARTRVQAGHSCPGRHLGSRTPGRDGAVGISNNRPTGFCCSCRRHWPIGWALPTGITAWCTAGATRCQGLQGLQQPSCPGGMSAKAWASAAIFSVVRASKGLGSQRVHSPQPCCRVDHLTGSVQRVRLTGLTALLT